MKQLKLTIVFILLVICSDQGQLKRVETLKSGMFWHVWVEFFQHTDINRVGGPTDKDT